MKALTWMLVVAISGISPAPSAAKSNDVFVSHYEPLQRLSIHSSSNIAERGAQQIQAAAPIELAFDALGRSFELELEPNSGLLSMASRGALADGVGIYRGQLAGNPDSWARIVVVDGMPRGLIWDGSEMFAVEAPGDSQLQISAPVIYRLADALIVPGSMSCGSSPISGSGAVAYNKLIGELDAAVAQAAGAISEITMGAIGDSLFTNDRGGDIDAAAAITTRLNNVDGIFSEQVGVHINVQLIETFSDPLTDPLTDQRDSSELLDELSGYRSITPAQNSLGLTHLFTGRDLLTTTVGIAWSGTLCESFHGAGLSESRRDATFDSLIAAHEIGHNFGAPHDGQPGACESVPEDFIMAPRLNQSQQFSDCSISIMQATAAAKSCVVALPAVDMGIALSGQISTLLLGANTDLVYDVRNNGTLLATNVVADFVLPVNLTLDSVVASSGDCNSGAGGSVNCSLGDVAELGSRTVTITTTPTSVGVATLSASVSADSDGRPENNQEVLQLTIDPAVDLAVNDFSTLSVQVQQSTTVNAVLENRSSLDATGISLGISLNDELQANSASWSIGSCTVTAHQIDCQASSFAAQSSSTLSVGITGLATGSKGYTFTLSSNEVDNDVANNSATGSIRVTSASGDDEGSGAAGPLFLCLLTLIAVLRRRRA